MNVDKDLDEKRIIDLRAKIKKGIASDEQRLEYARFLNKTLSELNKNLSAALKKSNE